MEQIGWILPLTGQSGQTTATSEEHAVKKVFRIAVALALLVTLAVPALALAAPGGSATPFKATYEQNETVYTCTGVRLVNKGVVRDNEVCLLTGDTSWIVPGIYTGDPVGDVPPFNFQWGSDYDAQVATSWTFVVAGNGNGTFAMHVVAYY